MIRNYFCPKCGAVADLKHMRAYTQEQLDEFEAAGRKRYDDWKKRYEQAEAAGKRPYIYMPTPHYNFELAVAMQQGVLHGEHLAASCPRCAYHWAEPIRPATAAAPIYDALTAEASA